MRRTITSDAPSHSRVSRFQLQDDSLVAPPTSLHDSSQPSSLTPNTSPSSDPLSPMSDLTPTTSADVLKNKDFVSKKSEKKEGKSLGQKLRRISRQISGGNKKEKKNRRVSATGKGMKVKTNKVISSRDKSSSVTRVIS